ncbi:DUF6404 family protein [Stenotrophomonas sp. ZAC14A_NAIMI4_1]|uniref:DUF6404 family protein n=1 Tax=Stenotrophomonas sp. ZAC14A_NAIMI4_1 TaxID=2072412 RepID=UPI000D54040F|nr:DUF6404 family protein [Stenotrophomonas sp. ZAC14A_NAIMI4_1]AWH46733.1 hypothetical protein C1926_17765 [Stenotrophomonas sp. ZAC14A_NAIMI4_1]
MITAEQRYPPKVQAALRHLDLAGVHRRHSAPPLHRLLWRMGFNAPPPILASVASNALLMGTWFTVGWGVLMWLLVWRNTHMPAGGAVFSALLAGVLFGLLMAVVMRVMRLRRGLPLWRDLPAAPTR